MWSFTQQCSCQQQHGRSVKRCQRFRDLKRAVFLWVSSENWRKEKSHRNLRAFSVDFLNTTFTPGGSVHPQHQDYIQTSLQAPYETFISAFTHTCSVCSTEYRKLSSNESYPSFQISPNLTFNI